jgi:hypothetical protein
MLVFSFHSSTDDHSAQLRAAIKLARQLAIVF